MVKAGNDGTGSRPYSIVGFDNKTSGFCHHNVGYLWRIKQFKHDTIVSSPAFTQKHKLPYITQNDEKMGININNKQSLKCYSSEGYVRQLSKH